MKNNVNEAFAKTFFEIAESDLRASDCLFREGHYPQAVFYLQQSVEKATKFYYVVTKVISGENIATEIKQIGHFPLKVFKKLAENEKKKIGNVIDTLEKVPGSKETSLMKAFDDLKKDYEKGFEDILKLLDEADRMAREIKSQEGYNFPPKEVLEIGIDRLKKIELQIESRLKEIELQIESLFKQMQQRKVPMILIKTLIEAILDCLLCNNPKWREKVKQQFNKAWRSSSLTNEMLEEIKKVFESARHYISFSLFFLSLVTTPHSSLARYPTEKHNPLEVYNKNHPLIQQFKELVGIMDNILPAMEILYNH